MGCPNTNLPEWKMLEMQYGKVRAMQIFKAFNDDIPSIAEAASWIAVHDGIEKDSKNMAFENHVRETLGGLFKGVEIFNDPEKFQEFADRHFPGRQVDVNRIGATLGNAVYIDETAPVQNVFMHEYAHLYWDYLPENHPSKKALKDFMEDHPLGAEEGAVIALQLAGSDRAKLDFEGTKLEKFLDLMKDFWASVKNAIGIANHKDVARMLSSRMWENAKMKAALPLGSNSVIKYMPLSASAEVADFLNKIELSSSTLEYDKTNSMYVITMPNGKKVHTKSPSDILAVNPSTSFEGSDQFDNEKLTEKNTKAGTDGHKIIEELVKNIEDVMSGKTDFDSIWNMSAVTGISREAGKTIFDEMKNIVSDLVNEGYTLLPEMRVVDVNEQIVSRVDLIAVKKKGRGVAVKIFDFKFSKTSIIDTEGELDPTYTKKGKFNNVEKASKFEKHGMQLSIYKKILSAMGMPVTIEGMYIKPFLITDDGTGFAQKVIPEMEVDFTGENELYDETVEIIKEFKRAEANAEVKAVDEMDLSPMSFNEFAEITGEGMEGPKKTFMRGVNPIKEEIKKLKSELDTAPMHEHKKINLRIAELRLRLRAIKIKYDNYVSELKTVNALFKEMRDNGQTPDDLTYEELEEYLNIFKTMNLHAWANTDRFTQMINAFETKIIEKAIEEGAKKNFHGHVGNEDMNQLDKYFKKLSDVNYLNNGAAAFLANKILHNELKAIDEINKWKDNLGMVFQKGVEEEMELLFGKASLMIAKNSPLFKSKWEKAKESFYSKIYEINKNGRPVLKPEAKIPAGSAKDFYLTVKAFYNNPKYARYIPGQKKTFIPVKFKGFWEIFKETKSFTEAVYNTRSVNSLMGNETVLLSDNLFPLPDSMETVKDGTGGNSEEKTYEEAMALLRGRPIDAKFGTKTVIDLLTALKMAKLTHSVKRDFPFDQKGAKSIRVHNGKIEMYNLDRSKQRFTLKENFQLGSRFDYDKVPKGVKVKVDLYESMIEFMEDVITRSEYEENAFFGTIATLYGETKDMTNLASFFRNYVDANVLGKESITGSSPEVKKGQTFTEKMGQTIMQETLGLFFRAKMWFNFKGATVNFFGGILSLMVDGSVAETATGMSRVAGMKKKQVQTWLNREFGIQAGLSAEELSRSMDAVKRNRGKIDSIMAKLGEQNYSGTMNYETSDKAGIISKMAMFGWTVGEYAFKAMALAGKLSKEEWNALDNEGNALNDKAPSIEQLKMYMDKINDAIGDYGTAGQRAGKKMVMVRIMLSMKWWGPDVWTNWFGDLRVVNGYRYKQGIFRAPFAGGMAGIYRDIFEEKKSFRESVWADKTVVATESEQERFWELRNKKRKTASEMKEYRKLKDKVLVFQRERTRSFASHMVVSAMLISMYMMVQSMLPDDDDDEDEVFSAKDVAIAKTIKPYIHSIMVQNAPITNPVGTVTSVFDIAPMSVLEDFRKPAKDIYDWEKGEWFAEYQKDGKFHSAGMPRIIRSLSALAGYENIYTKTLFPIFGEYDYNKETFYKSLSKAKARKMLDQEEYLEFLEAFDKKKARAEELKKEKESKK